MRFNLILVHLRLVDFRLVPGGARLHTCGGARRGAPGGVPFFFLLAQKEKEYTPVPLVGTHV